MWTRMWIAIVPALLLVGPMLLWTLFCWGGAGVMTMVTVEDRAELLDDIDAVQGMFACCVWPVGLAVAARLGYHLDGVWKRRHARARFGLCPSCDYDISGIVGRCPECGGELESREVV